MLSLTDGFICDEQLLNSSYRQMVMVDACRTHIKPEKIGAIPWPREQWLRFDGYSEARTMMDSCIVASPAGKMIIHATGDNTSAFERPEGKGGEFTLAMLDVMYDYQQQGEYGQVPIPVILENATEILASRNIMQIPTCVYHDGLMEVPFGIVSPEFRVIEKEPKQRKDNKVATVLLAAGIGIIAFNLLKKYS